MMSSSAAAVTDTRSIEPGVRGGLLLLVLWFGVVDPIYSIALNGFVAWHWQQSFPSIEIPVTNLVAYVGVRAILRFAAALALIQSRRSGAVWFALAILWLSGPAYVVGSWALFNNQLMPWALIRSSAVAAACTLYLFRSERVKLTYGFDINK
jgi:hypothetical protein